MKSNKQKADENGLVVSYLTLRNLIGFLGILLPILLALCTYRSSFDRKLEPSISDYYYTSSGEIFTSIFIARNQGYIYLVDFAGFGIPH